MSKNRKEIGSFGERIAEAFLERKGYLILHRNFKCKLGEIDIIARDKEAIVFVEVRTRFSSSYGSPFESILWNKKKKLIMLANFYISKFGLEDGDFRFDVISVVRDKGVLDVKLIKDAFWEV